MSKKTTTAGALKSTQNSLQIAEIKDGVVIMRDGSLRAIIMATALNFDLMSNAEQESIEFAFQGFLNSLHYPVQIIVRSIKMNLDSYLAELKDKRTTQDNELLGTLMDDYIFNIKEMLQRVNIMDKQFFVVVPYVAPISAKLSDRSSLVTGVESVFKPGVVVNLKEEDFRQYKTELVQRVELVLNGLNHMGVRSVPLNTEELIDLYYSFYNPGTAQAQKLTDFASLQAPVVTKAVSPSQTVAPTQQEPTPMPTAQAESLSQPTVGQTINPTTAPTPTAQTPIQAPPTQTEVPNA